MMALRERVIALGHALEMRDLMLEKEGHRLDTDHSKLVVAGIKDLDFDPVYYLATGITSPEGLNQSTK
jgi:hypothetical protein